MAKKKRTAAPRKAISERRYEVKAEIANFTLAKAKSALTLEIYSRRIKIGELQIGRGSVYWWGAHKQRAKRLSWGRLAERLNELAYGDQQ